MIGYRRIVHYSLVTFLRVGCLARKESYGMKKHACLVVLIILLAIQFPACFKLNRSDLRPEGGLLVVPTMVLLLTNTETNVATQEDIFQLHKEIAAWKEFFVREVGPYIELELHFVQIDDYVGLEDFTKMSNGGYHLLARDAATLLRYECELKVAELPYLLVENGHIIGFDVSVVDVDEDGDGLSRMDAVYGNLGTDPWGGLAMQYWLLSKLKFVEE